MFQRYIPRKLLAFLVVCNLLFSNLQAFSATTGSAHRLASPTPTAEPGPDQNLQILSNIPTPVPSPPQTEELRARQAMEVALIKYLSTLDGEYEARLEEIVVEGDHASGKIKWETEVPSVDTLGVITAQRSPDGSWQAIVINKLNNSEPTVINLPSSELSEVIHQALNLKIFLPIIKGLDDPRPDSESDVNRIAWGKLVREMVAQQATNVNSTFYYEVVNVKSNDLWGFANVYQVRKGDTHASSARGQVILGYREVQGEWQIYFPEHPDYNPMLAAISEDLIDSFAKQILKPNEIFSVKSSSINNVTGYRLPWSADIQATVNQNYNDHGLVILVLIIAYPCHFTIFNDPCVTIMSETVSSPKLV